MGVVNVLDCSDCVYSCQAAGALAACKDGPVQTFDYFANGLSNLEPPGGLVDNQCEGKLFGRELCRSSILGKFGYVEAVKDVLEIPSDLKDGFAFGLAWLVFTWAS